MPVQKNASGPVLICVIRYGRPEIRDVVLRVADIKAMLTPTTDKWLGPHSAARAGAGFSTGSTQQGFHVDAISAFILRIQELVPKENWTSLGIGAYDLACKWFQTDSLEVLTQVRFYLMPSQQASRGWIEYQSMKS